MSFLAGLLRRPRRAVAVWGVIAALTLPGLAGLRHDNSPEVFFVRDAEALARYRDFADVFDEHGTLRIVLRGPAIWSGEGLAWLRTIEFEAARQPGVVAAAGLWGLFRESWRPWPPADAEAFRDAAVAAALARNAGWVSGGGDTVSVLCALDDLDPAARRELLDGLDRLLAERPNGITASVTGLALVNRALDDALRGIVLKFFPIVVLLLVGLLLVSVRSVGDVAAALLFVGFAQGILFGAMGYAGASFDVVTSILPPLTFVLSLATAVHLLLEWRAVRRRISDPLEAVVETYRRKSWPVLWTGITTAAAFGSLAISKAPPVRSLGIWSAVGIGCMLLVAFTLYPVLLAGGGRRLGATAFERYGRRLGGRVGSWAIRRRAGVGLTFGGLTLLLLAGLPRLTVETGVLDYFRPSHPVRAAVDQALADGLGTVSAELVLTAPAGESFEDAALVEGLRVVATRLRAEPLVLGVVSPSDILAEGSADELDAFRRQGLATLLSDGGDRARVSIFLPLVGFSHLSGLFDRAVAVAREELQRAEVWITGRYPMVLAAQRTLLRTMVAALSVTLLSVAVAFRLLLRGTRRALVALLPNLWPVAVVLGAMGWSGVPIDSGTVMVAAVALGLAVDDTLHFFGGLRCRPAGEPARAAVIATLERVAPAQLLTSSILALGFGVCALSEFVPVARFGALAALAVAAALAADLLLLPALLARPDGAGSTWAARGRDRVRPGVYGG